MDKQHSIMIIEDEHLLLQAICKKLEKHGFNCVSCTNANQAIDYLESLPTLPDAIWLDYYLKEGMNGLEFMSAIKNNPKWAHIPVLVVSNSASPDKVHAMLGLGAKEYFLKAEKRLDDIIMEIKKYIAEPAAN